MVIFNSPLRASTTLRRENSRLNPWRGLIRLNLGLRDSAETSSLVWAKVADTASTAVTPRKGPATTMTVMMHFISRGLRMLGIAAGTVSWI